MSSTSFKGKNMSVTKLADQQKSHPEEHNKSVIAALEAF